MSLYHMVVVTRTYANFYPSCKTVKKAVISHQPVIVVTPKTLLTEDELTSLLFHLALRKTAKEVQSNICFGATVVVVLHQCHYFRTLNIQLFKQSILALTEYLSHRTFPPHPPPLPLCPAFHISLFIHTGVNLIN